MSTSPPDGAGSEGTSVDDLERLTSYLDGTLAAEERAALEAELAGDAALRSRLEELERADRVLAELEPTPLPTGARERLDATLADTFDEVLSPAQADGDTTTPLAPTTAEASGQGGDELSWRRRARTRSPVPAMAGVAAGLVLLVGGVAGLSQLSIGGDDDAAMLQADQAEDAPAADDPELSGVDDSLAADLPMVIDDDRTADQEDAQQLLGDPQLQALAQRGLSMEDGATLAEDVQRRVLGDALAGPSTQTEEDAGDEAMAEDQDRSAERGDTGVRPLVTRDGASLDAAVTEDLQRCLTELLDPGEQAVPVAIELVTLDGGDAAIFGLLTLDPETGAFSRIEAWTLALDSCQVLRFDQS